MEAVKFPEQTHILAENQDEYNILPTLMDDKTVTSIWKLTPEELKHIQETGLLYVRQMNFNQPVQPIFITVNRGDVIVPLKHYQLVRDRANPQFLITAEGVENGFLYTFPTTYTYGEGCHYETKEELITEITKYMKEIHNINLTVLG